MDQMLRLTDLLAPLTSAAPPVLFALGLLVLMLVPAMTLLVALAILALVLPEPSAVRAQWMFGLLVSALSLRKQA